jgi:hypothetical protein
MLVFFLKKLSMTINIVLFYFINFFFFFFFFLFTGWFTLPPDPTSAEELRRRCEDLDSADISDSSSESGSTAHASGFNKTSSSPSSSSKEPGSSIPGPSTDYPSPNISVGPPIHPSPHLLPYLYPHGLYPGHHGPALHQLLGQHPPPLSLFTGSGPPGIHPQLLFNAQLALAAQHPLFGHAYPGLGSALSAASSIPTSTGPLLSERLKAVHRFTPYGLQPVTSTGSSSASILGTSPLGSAFETVTPGSLHGSPKHSPRLDSSNSDTTSKNNSIITPTPIIPRKSLTPPSPSVKLNNNTSPVAIIKSGGSPSTTTTKNSTTAVSSELKSIEKMVNGLDNNSKSVEIISNTSEKSIEK